MLKKVIQVGKPDGKLRASLITGQSYQYITLDSKHKYMNIDTVLNDRLERNIKWSIQYSLTRSSCMCHKFAVYFAFIKIFSKTDINSSRVIRVWQ